MVLSERLDIPYLAFSFRRASDDSTSLFHVVIALHFVFTKVAIRNSIIVCYLLPPFQK